MLSFGQTYPLFVGVGEIFSSFFYYKRERIRIHTRFWVGNWVGGGSFAHGYNSTILGAGEARGGYAGKKSACHPLRPLRPLRDELARKSCRRHWRD